MSQLWNSVKPIVSRRLILSLKHPRLPIKGNIHFQTFAKRPSYNKSGILVGFISVSGCLGYSYVVRKNENIQLLPRAYCESVPQNNEINEKELYGSYNEIPSTTSRDCSKQERYLCTHYSYNLDLNDQSICSSISSIKLINFVLFRLKSRKRKSYPQRIEQ